LLGLRSDESSLTAPLSQIRIDAIGTLNRSAAVGSYAIDVFAAFLRVEVASLRQDVNSAANYTINSLAIRSDRRKDAAIAKRVMTDLIPKAAHTIGLLSRLDIAQLERSTVAKDGGTPDQIGTIVRQSRELSTNIQAVLAQRDYVRLPAGGGSEQDRVAVSLIENLARIWTRHTNKSAPGGASGPFVEFVAAVWVDLMLPELRGQNGKHQPLVDAIGNRVVKFHRRHNLDKNNQGLGHKRSPCRRALSRPSKRR
jgi:hypothetical protein